MYGCCLLTTLLCFKSPKSLTHQSIFPRNFCWFLTFLFPPLIRSNIQFKIWISGDSTVNIFPAIDRLAVRKCCTYVSQILGNLKNGALKLGGCTEEVNWCYHLKPVCQRFFSKDPLLKSANKCTVISMWIQSDAFQSLLQFQTVTIYSRSSRPVYIVDSTICLKRMWPLKNCFLFRRDKNCNNGNYRTVELANHWSADRSVLVDPAVIQSSTNWQALGSLRFVYKSRDYSSYSIAIIIIIEPMEPFTEEAPKCEVRHFHCEAYCRLASNRPASSQLVSSRSTSKLPSTEPTQRSRMAGLLSESNYCTLKSIDFYRLFAQD